MRITCDNKTAERKNYCPIVIGNGDLALQIDYEGTMKQGHQSGWGGPKLESRIHRAGYRYDSSTYALIPFGAFEQELAGSGEVKSWTQTLDIPRGLVESSCCYENGLVVESTVFCHLEHNVIAVRKRIVGDGPIDYTFRYRLGDVSRMRSVHAHGRFSFDVGEGQHQGVIAVWSPEMPVVGEGEFRGEVRESTYFIAFDEASIAWSQSQTFASLLASHCDAWARYWEESYVRIPDEPIQKMYNTAQYYLRVISTAWSISVGPFETHWNGKFFAFDEQFNASALFSSGHLNVARKVTVFRHACLDRALGRASHPRNGAARYPWQTLEDGREGCSSIYTIEHIFHMASIAVECFDDFRYSGDLTVLREKGYPVIKGCAQFFNLMATSHRADGAVIIGRCTDLERLGGGRENAFMTTCGAIATLRAAIRSARLLNEDADLVARWSTLADDLHKGLPHDGSMYVPYPGCDQKSIGVYSGIYPYPALPLDDEKLLAAIDDFDAGGGAFGNMYKAGQGLCTWYAAWKAVVRARLGDAETAHALLSRAAEQTGCFSEVFEIYEINHNPWFSTAAGTIIQAVNDMLLQVDWDEHVKIAPAVPAAWTNYAFKLQGPNGEVIEVEAKDGKAVRIK